MFNNIFGVVLWKGVIENKPPDMGKIQATRKGNFLIKCRLLIVFYACPPERLRGGTHEGGSFNITSACISLPQARHSGVPRGQ